MPKYTSFDSTKQLFKANLLMKDMAPVVPEDRFTTIEIQMYFRNRNSIGNQTAKTICR